MDDSFDAHLAAQITGMEILRRIIGLAQLPLELSLEERKDLLAEAADLVKG
jgi:5-methylthioribose kinase